MNSHSNETSEPREDSHRLDCDTNVANKRTICEADAGNEVEDDNQNGPGSAEHQEAPRIRDAVVIVEIAVLEVFVDSVAVKHVDS